MDVRDGGSTADRAATSLASVIPFGGDVARARRPGRRWYPVSDPYAKERAECGACPRPGVILSFRCGAADEGSVPDEEAAISAGAMRSPRAAAGAEHGVAAVDGYWARAGETENRDGFLCRAA